MVVLLPVFLCAFAGSILIDLFLMGTAAVAVRRVHLPVAGVLFLSAAVSALLTLLIPVAAALSIPSSIDVLWALLPVLVVMWLGWQTVTLGVAAWAIAQLSVAALHARGETFWTRAPLQDDP